MRREQVSQIFPVMEKHLMVDRGEDAVEHLPSPLCWCMPRLEFVDPGTGNEVWIHHEPH
jgi:hypothetical protein